MCKVLYGAVRCVRLGPGLTGHMGPDVEIGERGVWKVALAVGYMFCW